MGLIKANLQKFQNERNSSFGASILNTGQIKFQLPAPSAKTVDLLIHGNTKQLPLTRCSQEVFELITDLADIDTKYQYLIDGTIRVPDPASRYQPEGVHGPSQIIDPKGFEWTDSAWKGRGWQEAIIYELHIGTFTESGNFKATIEKLDQLIALGITAIELMPVAEFPGNRNWGYDGVLLFAPTHNYGHPDELKQLINACHEKGLMIFLDVVYNHFGPEGNYLHSYADYFFTDKYKTPWGKAINFDGQNSNLVREFFIDNALYWLTDFHFDGLRLDAVHAINDSSKIHIVSEICEAAQSLRKDGRNIHIILENDDNNSGFLQRNKIGESAYATAQWNDDMHHIMHVIASGEQEGYYSDYALPDTKESQLSKLGRALTEGFIYQGEISLVHEGRKRGGPSKHLPPNAFISFLQNHDQIGNRAFGERIEKIASIEKLKAITSIFLLNPEIPMLFMGEEWAASTPFYYFCNLGPDLAPLVTKGRRDEFKHFTSFNDPAKLATIPDPCSIDTFKSCILKWQERSESKHQDWLKYYQSLIQIRKDYVIPILSQLVIGEAQYTVKDEAILEAKWTLQDKRTLRLIANLSDTNISIDINISNLSKPFFQTSDDCYDKLCQGNIASYSVIWLLE